MDCTGYLNILNFHGEMSGNLFKKNQVLKKKQNALIGLPFITFPFCSACMNPFIAPLKKEINNCIKY